MPDRGKRLDDASQDRLQLDLQQRIERSGKAWLSTTILTGRRALRVNINSFLTERRHIDDLVQLLKSEVDVLVTEVQSSE